MNEEKLEKIYNSNVHYDLKVVISLYEKPIQSGSDLIESLGEPPESSVYGRIEILEEAEIIKDIAISDNPRHTKELVLWDYAGIKPIFEEMRKLYLNRVSLEVLACLIGKTPSEVESEAFMYAKDYKIRIVDDSFIDGPLRRRLEALALPDYYSVSPEEYFGE